MSELELYKKMYATVVGGVDGALQQIAGILAGESCDREDLAAIGTRLRQVLLAAEELYLSAEDEEA